MFTRLKNNLYTETKTTCNYMKPSNYYDQIIAAKSDLEMIGDLLFIAVKDDQVMLKDYQYLVSVAYSLGFTFSENLILIK